MIFVYIISIILLFILFAQDWKTRSVQWYLFPCILLCTIFINVYAIQNYISVVVFNLVIIIIQLSIILLYLKYKNYPWRKLTTIYFALGDILFLSILAFSFSTQTFLVFNICTIIMSLIIAHVFNLRTIPFAGIQSIFLAFLLMYKLIVLL